MVKCKIRVVEKRTGNVSYPSRGFKLGDSVFGGWGSAAVFPLEEGLQATADLRSRGFDATAISLTGGHSLEPAQPAPAPVQHASVTWRGVTPSLVAGGKWVFAFRDPDSGAIQTIVKDSPTDVISTIQDLSGWDRVSLTLNPYSGHPVFRKFVNSLPAEPGMRTEPGAPQFNQPAPRTATPGRVLRPGSNGYTAEDLPQRPVQSGPIVREDFSAWERTATARQFQDRCKSDPIFLAWADSQTASR
jgi:hypothetical protein